MVTVSVAPIEEATMTLIEAPPPPPPEAVTLFVEPLPPPPPPPTTVILALTKPTGFVYVPEAVKTWIERNAPSTPVIAPVALRVPVTATPALVTATTVEPPLCMFRLPVASEVTITPPPPDVEAFNELAIYIS
jgi:hypothetical protein